MNPMLVVVESAAVNCWLAPDLTTAVAGLIETTVDGNGADVVG
jgi:hypothetical protein